MAGSRFPSDVRLLEWTSREDFGRVRAEWMELIRRDVNLLAAGKLVLAEIGARLGFDRNHAWPSIPRLAADLGLSEPTVKRAIARAIERGYLTCEKRGFGGSNHYAMAASRSIANEVVEAHEERVAKFIDTRRPSLRSPMIPMVEAGSNEITGDLHGLLGEGDEVVGARRAARLSKGRLAYLAEQIELEGIVGAATDIQSAIRLAITLESKTKTEVSP